MLHLSTILAICLLAVKADEPARPTVIVVVGAAGAAEFEEQFREWSDHWQSAAGKATAEFVLIGSNAPQESSDRERLQAALAQHSAETTEPLWLVLIGHGTYDGQVAKFNLRGPDLQANELAEWLGPVSRPTAIINCASASAPFINRLAGANRIVITATRSGNEQNFARFGQYLAAAIDELDADLDKDGQVSLLEAYLTACRQVQEFYDQEARLATEHALLDDNGDGLGTPATWFRGLRATQRAKDGATLDGTRAHQWHLVASDDERRMPAELRGRRDAVELQIAALRLDREQLGDDAYFQQLEPLVLELARIYQEAEKAPPSDLKSAETTQAGR